MQQHALPMPRGTEATTLVLLLSCGCDFWTTAASSKRIQFHSFSISLMNLTESSFAKRPVNNIPIPELVSIRIFTSEPSFRHHEVNRARCQLQIFIDQVRFFIIFYETMMYRVKRQINEYFFLRCRRWRPTARRSLLLFHSGKNLPIPRLALIKWTMPREKENFINFDTKG
jgi:hypothetical protein